jgi:hypothetical protein
VSDIPACTLFLMRNLPRLAEHIGFDFLVSTLPRVHLDQAGAAGWEFHILSNSQPPGTFSDDRGTFSPGARTGVLRCGHGLALPAAA